MRVPIAAMLSLACALSPASPRADEARGWSDAPAAALSGVKLVSSAGKVEYLDPLKARFAPVGSLPLLVAAGAQIRTGILSRAALATADGALLELGSRGLLRCDENGCRLRDGRLRAAGPPHWIASVETAGVPALILGKAFTVETDGKGKGQMAKLGLGRAVVARLVAAFGFVEAQLPMGTIRVQQLPLALHEGTVVDTGASSYAVIAFPDGSRVKLRADSTGSTDSPTRCTLGAGAADVEAGPKGKLEMRTTNRPVWVRGAAFTVQLNPDKESRQDVEPPLPIEAQPRASLPGGFGWDGSGGR